MTTRIIGTGSALPLKVLTNAEMETIVETSDEWIKSRTGIEQRHIAIEETTTSLAVEAAQKALTDANTQPEEIDLIIVGSVSTDRHFPSTACEVQSAIGAVNATAFDINAACSGFLFGLGIANAYFNSKTFRKALIIGAEVLSKMMSWEDRSTCVLFGDGAGAAVVERSDEGIISMTQGSDGAKGGVLSCYNRPVNNPFVTNDTTLDYTSMNGQEVYKFAVRTVPEAISKVLTDAGIGADEVKYFILHQAGWDSLWTNFPQICRNVVIYQQQVCRFS